MGPCCTPAAGTGGSERPGRHGDVVVGARASLPGGEEVVPLVFLNGGTFLMGSEGPDVNPGDGEGPVREVTVSPLWIGRHAVTNAEFARFVEVTGYRTGAERFGWSFVFASFLPSRLRRGAQRPESAPWWCRVEGAYWAAPEGPGSDVEDRLDHPVVHVDHADARAFCDWAGLRLPTEAEWEFAARGGLEGRRFAWGDELTPRGEHRCNIWQGTFPVHNSVEDGYAGTAPAERFRPNGYGLFNVAGNVWEWCADWWSARHSADRQMDPQGPRTGAAKVMRGGSYLCHDSYCNRYRVAARTSNDPDSCSGNLGFRCAKSR